MRLPILMALIFISACSAQPGNNHADQDRLAINALAERLTEGWNAKSGTLFAANFSDEAVFTVWFGFQMTGPAAIAEGHQIIFDGIYAESDALFSIVQIRLLDNDTAIVYMNGYLFAKGSELNKNRPADFVPMMVAQRVDEIWKIEAFQNTKLDLSSMEGGKDIREDAVQ